VNKWLGVGRLTRDPEVRYTAGEKPTAIANFSIAVDRRYADKDTADFFQVSAFGKVAEFCEKYLKKGTKVIIDGRLQQDVWTKKDGTKADGVKIIAESIEFAQSKPKEAPAEAPAPQPAPEPTPRQGSFLNIPDGMDDGDLPFNL